MSAVRVLLSIALAAARPNGVLAQDTCLEGGVASQGEAAAAADLDAAAAAAMQLADGSRHQDQEVFAMRMSMLQVQPEAEGASKRGDDEYSGPKKYCPKHSYDEYARDGEYDVKRGYGRDGYGRDGEGDSKPISTSVCAWTCSRIVTRLWTVTRPEKISALDVSDEFEDGYAPQVTVMPGFQAYVGAPTGSIQYVFFLNVFETEDQVIAAQQGAVDFVAQNEKLRGEITPFLFTGGQIKLQLVADELCDARGVPMLNDMYLAIRVWEADKHSVEELVRTFECLGSAVRRQQGFQMYVVAAVQNSDVSVVGADEMVFEMSLFDTLAQAELANAQAVGATYGTHKLGEGGHCTMHTKKAKLVNAHIAYVDFAFLGRQGKNHSH